MNQLIELFCLQEKLNQLLIKVNFVDYFIVYLQFDEINVLNFKNILRIDFRIFLIFFLKVEGDKVLLLCLLVLNCLGNIIVMENDLKIILRIQFDKDRRVCYDFNRGKGYR